MDNVTKKIRNVSNTSFWYELWVGGEVFKLHFGRLFNL